MTENCVRFGCFFAKDFQLEREPFFYYHFLYKRNNEKGAKKVLYPDMVFLNSGGVMTVLKQLKTEQIIIIILSLLIAKFCNPLGRKVRRVNDKCKKGDDHRRL